MSRRTHKRLLERGLELHQAGQLAEAEPLYRRALAEKPRDPEILHLLGVLRWQQGAADEAVAFLRQAASLRPDESRYHSHLGNALQAAGRLEEALLAQERAVALDQGSATAWSNLGVARRALGDVAGAVEALRRAVSIDTGRGFTWQNLGSALEALGEFAEAEAAYRQALHRSSREPDTWNNLGNTLLAQGRFAEAEDAYATALGLEPRHAPALCNAGLARQALGDLDGAMDRYEQAIAADPTYVDAYTHLGLALQSAGHLEPAVATWQKGASIQPTPEGLLNLSGALCELGYRAHAEETLRELVRLWPDYPRGYTALGALLAEANRAEEAVSAYEQALVRDPENHEARHFLAALAGRSPDRAPDAYVRRLFDDYARRFDRHLRQDLRYRTPELMRELIVGHLGEDEAVESAADLGCGTGLMGEHLRALARRLVGVDLSPQMLHRARLRGIYDELHAAELGEFLRATPERFDLLVAADVLIYTGDLDPLFSALRAASAPGALLAFSTELGEEADWQLRPTGRYTHSRGYVERLAAEHGWTVLRVETADLRQERGEWVSGELFLLRG